MVAAVTLLQRGDQLREVQLLVDANQEMFRVNEIAQPPVGELEESRVPAVTVQRLEHHIPRLRPISTYETFPAPEARRIARRLEFHHTAKHGSWLNMAEIELSVLARACLRGRNGDEGSLEKSVDACVSDRNSAAAIINWRFTAKDARRKLHRLYPCHN